MRECSNLDKTEVERMVAGVERHQAPGARLKG